MKRSVLYIEDNEKIGSWIKGELEQRGFSVQWLLTGEGAEKEVNQHEIVILDIMLPDLDGFTMNGKIHPLIEIRGVLLPFIVNT